MSEGQRAGPSCSSSVLHAPLRAQVYNIIPTHDIRADHPSLRYPEVHAAIAALRTVDELRKPPDVAWDPHYDLMDWLGLFFGFQRDNVKNQREHLVLHLANSQMRLQPPPSNPNTLDPNVLQQFRHKLLGNYTSWCSYLGHKSQISISCENDLRQELLYVALYLLIWGEAANIRFMPECICYIYHHMAMELNRILDTGSGRSFLPSVSGDCAFLKCIVVPIYQTIKTEVESSKNGTKPHSDWRNYDDLNEFFWSRRCFKKLGWPINFESNYFATVDKNRRVGKTGFVEKRTLWNIFRSFDRLWVLLILFLQASVIVAWEDTTYPWQALGRHDVQVKLLTCLITWAGLRVLQAALDAGTQCSLVSRETMFLAVRMVLKLVVALAWTILFVIFYARIWKENNSTGSWSHNANQGVFMFLVAGLVFVTPELLALLLFILPWLRNALESSNWGILHGLTWWFHSRLFVGRELSEGLVNSVKYALFWIIVLGSKFTFSYFLQIKPMVEPTMSILDLENLNYRWHEFFGSNDRIAVLLLWLPVVLIYFMDVQIWYSIFSSFLGAAIGLFSHLGEIRNIEQFRIRFQLFSSAMQFNLLPEQQFVTPEMMSKNKLHDAIHKYLRRCRHGMAYKKIESNQVEATRFALIWNEIITTLREEDLISDQEYELLELLPNCWDIRVIRWPNVLLCNELLHALRQATELADSPDNWIWQKISKIEYRRCAAIEAYDGIKYLFLRVVKHDSEEHSIVKKFFQEIDSNIQIEKFTETYKIDQFPKIHSKLISLLEILMKPKKDMSKAVNVLQALYELCVRELPRVKKTIQHLREEGLAPKGPATDEGLLFENAVEFPDAEDEFFYRQVRRLHTILTSRDPMHNVPKNIEARRRIAFFSNSLFMNMPRAPKVEKMMAFSVLTPYYEEEVCFNKENLRSPNEDGVSILFYLQKIYEDEWKNFMERMHREGMEDDDDIWEKKSWELRLWASYRGQTLSRTVRGMMYYYRALKMLSYLDSASEMDVRTEIQELVSYHSLRQNNDMHGLNSARPPASCKLARASSNVSLLFKGHEYGTALMKFTYVVACQLYGQHKEKGNSRAEEILNLMKSNEALRVAYVDEVHLGIDEVEYYSVLLKYDHQLQREVEIYRIRLPGPIKMGEGKPENQNHAIIFTRGDAIQTIDMNQDNYFEEALKMRNLLEEFNIFHGIRKPTILGVRENIFTGSVSSLAWFMSAQETSFVTIGQRVLANILKVRMHYGHPDVFDRFWFLSRGGISKASKVININEDIFAGFNCTLRGGNVTHHEYIQVGKGRDVGLNQISMFEAKVASGNGEQVLSRDVYRLGHRLDFFRMLSFYCSSVGFFFNTLVVLLSVYAFLWGYLYLVLSGIETNAMASTNSNKALSAVINQEFIIQLGLFTAIPTIVESSLELGFLPAVWEFVLMQFQLSPIFYTFSVGTRAHFFGRTILHGGAKYLATGRGFVVQHKNFAENYRIYSRSHFVKAIELGVILIVYASYTHAAKNTFSYIDMAISSWLLVVSWIMSPFLFNPSGFDWVKSVSDCDDFINWIWSGGGVFTKAEESWETWWYEEQDYLRKTSLWGKLLEIILDLRFFFFQYGIVYHLKISDNQTTLAVYLLSWIYVVAAVGIYVFVAYARDRFKARKRITYRITQFIVIVLAILAIVLLLQFTSFEILDLLSSLLAFIPTGWGLISIAQVLRPFLQHSVVWDTVVSLARLYDLLFGMIVMIPVALLSWLPGLQSMQTRILFNEAFSRGLEISRIISGKKTN